MSKKRIEEDRGIVPPEAKGVSGGFLLMEKAMGRDKPIAHVAEDGRVQGLAEHLRGSAERAAKFAGEFGCARWGRLAGL